MNSHQRRVYARAATRWTDARNASAALSMAAASKYVEASECAKRGVVDINNKEKISVISAAIAATLETTATHAVAYAAFAVARSTAMMAIPVPSRRTFAGSKRTRARARLGGLS